MRQLVVVLVAVAWVGCTRTSKPEGGKLATTMPAVGAWKMRPLPQSQANFIVVGDWGSNTKEQRMVATATAEYVQAAGVQFNGVLGIGDNMYDKLKDGARDKMFRVNFEEMYDPQRLNFPFYLALGNHDYDNDSVIHELEYAKLNPQSRWKLPAKWYRLDLPEDRPLLTVLVLDTDRHRLSKADWAKQIAWLEEELAKPRKTQWLVCVAHHGPFSNGAHADNGVIQRELGPLIKKYNVDFYLSGHDHDLQHLQVKGWWTTFVLAGAGGRDQKPMSRELRGAFSRKLFGFAHLRFSADRVEVKYINATDGQLVHHFVRYVDGRIEVMATTPSDKTDGIRRYFRVFDEGDKTTPVLPSLDPAPGEDDEDWESPSS
jgi:hypothetical protein